MPESGDAGNGTRDIEGATAETLAKGIAGAARHHGRRHDKFLAQLEAEQAAERRLAWSTNREAALRGPVDLAGTPHWWCVCACRWSGLRVPDPEVAKREYDKHPCSMNGDAAVDRALAELENTNRETTSRTTQLTKRPGSSLVPALAEQRTSGDEVLLGGERQVVAVEAEEQVDAVEKRMSLLELK